MPEMWTLELSAAVESFGALGERLEGDGWKGVCFVDSQNMSPEPYVALAALATATSRLGLGIGVTNPVTRHPALAAAASVTLQRVSKGRMTLSIGRGDSANAHLGLAPIGIRQFDQYVGALAAYLRGETVPLEEAADLAIGDAKTLATLDLADEPMVSRLEWMLPSEVVELEVAASGQRVLEIGARHADRVMLAVGAVPDRVAWASKQLKDAQANARSVRVGAYINLLVNRDVQVARRHVRGVLAGTSRFSVMHGSVNGPTSEASAATLAKLHKNYDMTQHGNTAATHGDVMDDAFVDEFAIAGPPDYCVRRLLDLAELGVDKFTVFPLGTNTDPAVLEEHRQLMAAEVIPAISDV